jgi:hypothetical protein
VRIVEAKTPRRRAIRCYHRGAATKASAILTLPEGPPVDCFFVCRLQIGRGDVPLGLRWARRLRNSRKPGGQPAAGWPNSRLSPKATRLRCHPATDRFWSPGGSGVLPRYQAAPASSEDETGAARLAPGQRRAPAKKGLPLISGNRGEALKDRPITGAEKNDADILREREELEFFEKTRSHPIRIEVIHEIPWQRVTSAI